MEKYSQDMRLIFFLFLIKRILGQKCFDNEVKICGKL